MAGSDAGNPQPGEQQSGETPAGAQQANQQQSGEQQDGESGQPSASVELRTASAELEGSASVVDAVGDAILASMTGLPGLPGGSAGLPGLPSDNSTIGLPSSGQSASRGDVDISGPTIGLPSLPGAGSPGQPGPGSSGPMGSSSQAGGLPSAGTTGMPGTPSSGVQTGDGSMGSVPSGGGPGGSPGDDGSQSNGSGVQVVGGLPSGADQTGGSGAEGSGTVVVLPGGMTASERVSVLDGMLNGSLLVIDGVILANQGDPLGSAPGGSGSAGKDGEQSGGGSS